MALFFVMRVSFLLRYVVDWLSAYVFYALLGPKSY